MLLMMMTNSMLMMSLQKNHINPRKNCEIPMNDEEEHDFMRNENYHYLAVTKPNGIISEFFIEV